MKLKNRLGKAFQKTAKTAKIQREIEARLLERLDFIKIAPRNILNLACDSSSTSAQLRKRYPHASVTRLEVATDSLQPPKRQGWFRKESILYSDMQQLPFANGAFDLVFSNQILHRSPDIPALLREMVRVMRQDACLIFSTLGPDTFYEIRRISAELGIDAPVQDFIDMHDIGDYMLQEKLLDPVVDMERLCVRFETINTLLGSLEDVNSVPKNKALSQESRNNPLMHERYHEKYFDGEKYPLSYELVYAHGWRGAQRLDVSGSETAIPLSAITRKSAG